MFLCWARCFCAVGPEGQGWNAQGCELGRGTAAQGQESLGEAGKAGKLKGREREKPENRRKRWSWAVGPFLSNPELSQAPLLLLLESWRCGTEQEEQTWGWQG